MPESIEVIRADELELPAIAHGFLGRRGGVSQGVVSGLNVGLGAGDDGDSVQRNRKMAVDAILPGRGLASVYQVHSPDCVRVDSPWPNADRPHADALVTNKAGFMLGIVTADCAPVLFADAEAGVVGAAHAGWKGAWGGVVENTVAAMESLGARASAIVGVVGPCIAQKSYEVDDRFLENFKNDSEAETYFQKGREGRWQFDLEGYVALRLRRANVGKIGRIGLDTYADEERFFSYRRATHRGELTYGRQFSLIGLACAK